MKRIYILSVACLLFVVTKVSISKDSNTQKASSESLYFRDNNSSDIKVYNGISYNENSKNNKLLIEGIEKYPDNKVIIFDRYEKIIIKIEKYNNDDNYWDGKTKSGDKLKPGVYYYAIKFKNRVDEKGWLYIKE